VVVLATPPFWLANAMTRGLLCALGMTAPYSRAGGRFLPRVRQGVPGPLACAEMICHQEGEA
jgi:hypothetical protein